MSDDTAFLKKFNGLLKQHNLHLPYTEEELLRGILERLGEKKAPKFIGKGAYANVFWLQGNRKKVVKLTSDPMDAYASEIIRRKPDHDSFVIVHDVFEIIPHKLFGIVNEKLTPLTEYEAEEWMSWEHILWEYHDFFQELRFKESKGLTLDFLERLEAAHEKEKEREEEERRKVEEEGEEWYGSEYPLPEWPSEDVMNKLEEWAWELEKRNIGCGDIRADNMMWRRRELVLSDFGNGTVPTQRLPKLHIQQELGF